MTLLALGPMSQWPMGSGGQPKNGIASLFFIAFCWFLVVFPVWALGPNMDVTICLQKHDLLMFCSEKNDLL